MDDLAARTEGITYYAEKESQRGEGRQGIVDGRVTQRGQPPGGALEARGPYVLLAVDL